MGRPVGRVPNVWILNYNDIILYNLQVSQCPRWPWGSCWGRLRWGWRLVRAELWRRWCCVCPCFCWCSWPSCPYGSISSSCTPDSVACSPTSCSKFASQFCTNTALLGFLWSLGGKSSERRNYSFGFDQNDLSIWDRVNCLEKVFDLERDRKILKLYIKTRTVKAFQ